MESNVQDRATVFMIKRFIWVVELLIQYWIAIRRLWVKHEPQHDHGNYYDQEIFTSQAWSTHSQPTFTRHPVRLITSDPFCAYLSAVLREIAALLLLQPVLLLTTHTSIY